MLLHIGCNFATVYTCCYNFWTSREDTTSSTCLVTEAKNEILSTWLLLTSQIRSADTAIPAKRKRRRMVSSRMQNNVSLCSIKFYISHFIDIWGWTWKISCLWTCTWSWLLRYRFLKVLVRKLGIVHHRNFKPFDVIILEGPHVAVGISGWFMSFDIISSTFLSALYCCVFVGILP